MNLVVQLLEDNREATNYVTQEGQFDPDIAELLMRNMALATERLGRPGLKHLSSDAVSLILDVANEAKLIAPMAECEKERLPGESDAAHSLRTNVVGPLHALQEEMKLHERRDIMVTEKQAAVADAGKAFEAIITETAVINAIEFNGVRNSTEYFLGNAVAAARRAERNARSRV